MGFIEENFKARLKKIDLRISVITKELRSLKKEKKEIICKFKNNPNCKILKATRKHQAARLLPSGSPAVCELCNTNINDAGNFGEKFCVGALTFHYLCAVLSPNVKRIGEEGLPTLVHQDLVNLLKQSSRVTCEFCQGSGASIHCHTCNMAYHLPCGLLSDCLCVASSNVSYCASHRPHTQHNTEINASISFEKSTPLPSSSHQTLSIATRTRRKLAESTVSCTTFSKATADFESFIPASPFTKGRIAPDRNVDSSESPLKVSEPLDGSEALLGCSISQAQKEQVVMSKSPFQDAARASVQTSVLLAEEELSGSVQDIPANPDHEFDAFALPQLGAEKFHCANGSAEASFKAKESLDLFDGNVVSTIIMPPSSEAEQTPLSENDTLICGDVRLLHSSTENSFDVSTENETVSSDSPSVSKETTEKKSSLGVNHCGNTGVIIAESTVIGHKVSLNKECFEAVMTSQHSQAAQEIVPDNDSLTPIATHYKSDREGPRNPDSSDPASSGISHQATQDENVTYNNNDSASAGFKLSNQNHLEELPIVEHFFKCNFVGCTRSFPCTSDLAAHRRTHSSSDSQEEQHEYRCSVCDLTFKRECSFTTHLRTHEAANRIMESGSASPNTDTDFSDSDLESDTSDLESDSSESDTHNKHAGCSSIKKLGEPNLKKSLSGVGKRFKCDYKGCERTFRRQCRLKDHKITHTGVNPYQCDYIDCDRAYTQKFHLNEHKRTHTGEKPYTCLDCNKSFYSQSYFETHKRMHEGKKRYKCYYKGCGIVFTASSNAELKAHQKTHTGKKPFKCPGCTATFTNPSYLRKHKLTHDPNRKKPYKCDFEGCNGAYNCPSRLKDHQRIHTGEKSFKCGHDGCELSFRMLLTLQIHIRTHTGVKPFKCTFGGCKSAFKSQSGLIRHGLTHTGIKPYKCDQLGCNLTFSQSNSLARHMVTHTGERPYKCDYVGCNADFAQSYPLTLHKRSHTAQ